MNSRDYPKYKTKYRVGNWREYEALLHEDLEGHCQVEAADGRVGG